MSLIARIRSRSTLIMSPSAGSASAWRSCGEIARPCRITRPSAVRKIDDAAFSAPSVQTSSTRNFTVVLLLTGSPPAHGSGSGGLPGAVCVPSPRLATRPLAARRPAPPWAVRHPAVAAGRHAMAVAKRVWHNYSREAGNLLGDTTIVNVKAADRPRYRRSLLWLGTRIADIGLWAGAAALLAIVALNAVNIVLRYFFRIPLSWAEEAMLYLMILGVYVGAVSVAWQQAHIRVDAVIDFAPPARRKMLQVVSTLVLAAVLAPVVFASFRVVSLLFDFDQRSDALHLPMWIAQSVVPISLSLIIVMSLLRIFLQVTGTEGEAKDDRGPI